MIIPKAFPQQDHEAHIQAHMAFMTSRMVQVNPQIYGLLQGHLMEHVSLQVKQEILQAFNQDPRMAELQSSNKRSYKRLIKTQEWQNCNLLMKKRLLLSLTTL
jgi:hypothetical protein